ncbi:PREDICTED: plasmalemma vesicle-associated protein [Pseudopodoces humilis]|uniref:plasmalemma vesicle-associated protein n=1 Tax=Pseudopodoces humilis TaxID=181119 RepID=UPI0006B6EF53|nr:PREDICTED: plasmalemma vesicle-associated protein [Pseudopodoces humilis]
MEKSSFAMAKFGLEPKEAMPKRDCGFYLKYIFLFTSLIQFLIILGLVLFMVYGNAQAGTDTHLRLLEEQVQSHYRRIVTLGATNANLSRALNATLKDKEKLQGLALKVQRELEKCNSSQASSSLPQLQQLVYQQVRLAECQMTATLINTSCSAEKLQLRQQLERAGSSQKSLEESGRQSQAGLAKATQERDRCQQELQSSRAEGDLSRMELQLQRHECRALQSDMNNKFPRISELVKQLQCGEAESELKQLRERALALLREHQERDSQYIWKSRCELNVQQCQLNCSREKQELENRIQALEKREKDGLEERKRLEQEKEKVGKELEEKRKEAAAQAESLREQLGVCMGTKMPHLELPGSRGPGSAARSSSFSGPGSYMEFLRNPATLGTMGKKNLEELQQMLQVMEQLMATLKSPSG